MLIIGSSREYDDITTPTLPPANYKIENICGELPVDIKFRPFKMGRMQTYLSPGLQIAARR